MPLRGWLFFWLFFGQKWTQKDQEHNFLELRDFVLMSQVILEEARNHSSISLKTFCMIFITKHWLQQELGK